MKPRDNKLKCRLAIFNSGDYKGLFAKRGNVIALNTCKMNLH